MIKKLFLLLLLIATSAFGQSIGSGTGLYGTTFPLLAPDGTKGVPSYSFGSSPTYGMYLSPGGAFLGFAVGNVTFATMGAGGSFNLNSTTQLGWSSSQADSAADTILLRDGAADTLAMRRGINSQTFRLYNTYTDASNYTAIQHSFTGGGSPIYNISPVRAGSGPFLSGININTGASSPIALQVGNVTIASINSNGLTIPTTTGALFAPRFIANQGTTPTIGSCGTSPTISGKDSAMKVVVGTATPTSCLVTFSATWTNPPACTWGSGFHGDILLVVTATTVTISRVGGAAFTNNANVDLICVGVV